MNTDIALEPEAEIARVVVIGKTHLSDGKVALRVQDMAEDGTLGDYRLYLAKSFGNAVVGNIYEYKRTKDGQYYPSSVRFVGAWTDAERRAQWAAEARAFDVADAATKLARKEETRHLIKETMQPLHEAYLRTNIQGRRALSVLVLEYLQNGDIHG